MTEPTPERRRGDPSNTDIEDLVGPLAPDDDVVKRIDMCNKEYPEILEDAADGRPGEQ